MAHSDPRIEKTLHVARCEIFSKLVLDKTKGPYRNMVETIKYAAEKQVEHAGSELNKGINRVLSQIRKDFERMSIKKTNDSDVAKAYRKLSHEMVDETNGILNGPIQKALEMCAQYT